MKYTETHEWIHLEGQVGIIGITEHAQKQLGDIVFVELPKIGRTVKAGDEIAVLESTKAAADVYTPVSGTILEVNESLKEKRLLNQARDSIKLLDKRLRKKATVIIQQAPLQCDSFLNDIIVLWNQSDSAKQAETEIRDKVDSNKDKIIEGLTDINVLTKYQLKQSRDSTKAAKEENKYLTKQVKKEKVKGNFKTIGASILSLFAGFGLSKSTP